MYGEIAAVVRRAGRVRTLGHGRRRDRSLLRPLRLQLGSVDHADRVAALQPLQGDLTWYDPNNDGEYYESEGRSVTLQLDVDGNANVALIAGPDAWSGNR